ncbi:MAG: MarR family transcriptional regulator [Myxococcales bacterium]|nr:MarR family transcriptional regulator [Myxococcales bacterium]
MHALQFGLKRAHQRVVGFAWQLLGPFGITPARLDMLQALAAFPEPPIQNELARALGVTRQTVSEMLEALERRGLVVRESGDLRGRRCNFVMLTAAARALLARVFAVLVRSGIAAKAAARMLVDIPAAPVKVANTLERTLEIRKTLRDRAFFRPPSVEREEMDGGAPLEGAERKLFDLSIELCQIRFGHLPTMYLLFT